MMWEALIVLPFLIYGGLLLAIAVMQISDILKDIWRRGL